ERAQEVDATAGDLLGLTETSEEGAPGDALFLRVGRQQGCRVDRARRDRVDADVRVPDFACERLRQADYAGLCGGIIRGRPDAPVLARGRGKVDDGAPAAFDHARQNGSAAGERGPQVGLQSGVPAGFVELVVGPRVPEAGAAREPAHGAEVPL